MGKKCLDWFDVIHFMSEKFKATILLNYENIKVEMAPMELYKYRNKISGSLIDQPVDKDMILELVTRGTLTPYDFVEICVEGNDDPTLKMISEVLPESIKKWALLRKIRSYFNKLWEAQLDDIMAMISSGQHPNLQLRQAERTLEEFRNQLNFSSIENELKRLWDEGDGSKFVSNEIKYRKRANDPVELIDLYPVSDDEGYLSADDLDKKYQDLEQKLQERSRDRGVYVFWSGEEPTYVGKARQNFGQRFGQHFEKQKLLCIKNQFDENEVRFLHDATKVQLYTLKISVGNKPISEFESLMIFYLGNADNKFRPRDNRNSGSSKNPLGVALNIIEQEIAELKTTGGVK
jgi:hypothetical protein